jgi:hypothetical protein
VIGASGSGNGGYELLMGVLLGNFALGEESVLVDGSGEQR